MMSRGSSLPGGCTAHKNLFSILLIQKSNLIFNYIMSINVAANGIPFGVPNQSEKGKYNLIPVNLTRTRNRFLFV